MVLSRVWHQLLLATRYCLWQNDDVNGIFLHLPAYIFFELSRDLLKIRNKSLYKLEFYKKKNLDYCFVGLELVRSSE